MTQVSKHKLDPELERMIRDELCACMAEVISPSMMQQFLLDFLSPTEMIMLSKRFMIMVLLMRGRSSEDIKDIVHVSNSAISSVGSWLKYPTPATQAVLKHIRQQKDWEALGDKVDAIIAKLPPGKYTNWNQAGKEKMRNKQSRLLKGRLR